MDAAGRLDARSAPATRRWMLGALGGAAALTPLALAACAAGSAPPAKKVRTSVSTVRFMALGSGASL